MATTKLSINDLEARFEVTREPLVVFRTSSGRIAIQSALLKPKDDGKARPKHLPPGSTQLALVHGHCRRDVLRAAKSVFETV